MKNFGFNFQNTYGTLPDVFYTRLNPTPVKAPRIVIFNTDLATAMDLDFSAIQPCDRADIFAGNTLPCGADPMAQAYAGHQFGFFTILGDGRAILWGEHITKDNRRFDIQFKGSGVTPYSRSGDGRATLAPMLREYIISEAMHALNIATARSLAVVATGEGVVRKSVLPGAILTRVASSHVRVGTFEFAAVTRDKNFLESMIHYTVKRHYPQLEKSKNIALALLKEAMVRQARLVVDWMRVGFIHGVMNTDNMAISGETIDYGPCAFMDAYDPATVFSSIDEMGRYAYANQPSIAAWNIAQFAETLLPFIDNNIDKARSVANRMIQKFSKIYKREWLTMMRAKLGLFRSCRLDEKLIVDLLGWMQENSADFTNTFRDLCNKDLLISKVYDNKTFRNWYGRWQNRLSENRLPLEASLRLMKSTNPSIIPRNHQVEQVLSKALAGNLQPLQDLTTALKTPYKDHSSLAKYTLPPTSDQRVYQTFCGT